MMNYQHCLLVSLLLVSDGLLADSAFRSFHGRFMLQSDSQTQISYLLSKFRSRVGRVILSSRLRRGYEDHASPVFSLQGGKRALVAFAAF